MYKHMLIATDGSELAQKAIDQGLALAKALGAKVTAVTVTEPWPVTLVGDVVVTYPIEEYEQSAAESAGKILSAVTGAATKQGVACTTVHVKDKYPAEGIIDTAKSKGCDLIVMSSHGRRGLTKLLLGSQAIEVLTHSTVPVLVCR
jgi:nucleotide-binding universal stress UspA family protein